MYTKCLVTHQDTTPDQQQDAGNASTIHHKTRAKTSSKGFQILSNRNIFFIYRYDTLLQKLPCLKGTLKRLQGTLLESSFSHRSNIWNMVLGCLMWIVWTEWNCRLFEDT